MVVKKSSRELEQDASSSQKSSSEEMPVIKMCGYLKKKRNVSIFQGSHCKRIPPEILLHPRVLLFKTKKKPLTLYISFLSQRVGGWQKLWFILQNQLLLSYKSREDYEKKLAPFRDVLNLVPGTVIRPSSRIRFTIESTSNIIYTFVREKRHII